MVLGSGYGSGSGLGQGRGWGRGWVEDGVGVAVLGKVGVWVRVGVMVRVGEKNTYTYFVYYTTPS